VVKLLGSLVSEEPRLARKLLEPLAAIVQNTQAKSLLYESVFTLTLALPYARKSDGSQPKAVPGIVDLCAEKLRQFVEELDQNLKYLGLVGFVSLMKSHPNKVVAHRNLILRCLTDDDVTIRSRALELLTGMVTKKNLQELVNQLMQVRARCERSGRENANPIVADGRAKALLPSPAALSPAYSPPLPPASFPPPSRVPPAQHVRLSDGAYRDELIEKIVFMCSRDKYSYMPDFKWYISTLVAMSSLHGTAHDELIASQITDVAIRVIPVREFAVTSLAALLLESDLAMGKSKATISQVLRAAAWIVGEYVVPRAKQRSSAAASPPSFVLASA
jgi:AP-3 complex subunit delta-1